MQSVSKIKLLVGMVALLVAGLLAVGVAQAQTTVPLASVSSMRGEYALIVNNTPLQVCQGEWESLNRYHRVCEDLVTDETFNLEAGRVREIVIYDGTLYIRVNESTTWLAGSNPDGTFADPSIANRFFELIDLVGDDEASMLGTTTVRGQSVTQYQFLSGGEENSVSYDLFVNGSGFVLKEQLSLRSTAETDLIVVADLWEFYDINSGIVVAPPPPNQVQFVEN